MGRRLALLIASNRYDDAGLRQLAAPPRDTESLAEVLADAEIAGFEVTTLINEPHHRVGAAIGEFYRTCRTDDLTLLYFSGHGLKDENGRLYLAMSNTQRDSLLFTSLPAEQIDQAMDGSAGRRQVLILDCCYSGAFPSGLRAKGDTDVHALERFRGRGRTVLTASDSTQYSFEGNRVKGKAVQSVFTKHLVQGLRDGSADLDGDGEITLDELYNYTYDRVVAETPHQRPKKQAEVEGRLVIARNVNWSLPVAEVAAEATAASQPAPDRPAGPVRWRRTAGILAGLAALLLIGGVLQEAIFSTNLFDGGPWRTLPYYVFGLIVLAAAAAVFAVRGSPGVLVGASLGSIWGLLFFGSEWIHRGSVSEGYFIELLGHLALAAAGSFALLALRRLVVVRWRSLRDPLVWLVFIAATTGSLALVSQQRAVLAEQRIFDQDRVLDSLALAFLVLLVLAFSVPIVTLFLLPDRIAAFVLIGWSACGLGLSATIVTWTFVTPGAWRGIAFGCSLILLLIAAALRVRRHQIPVGRPRRRLLVAVVAAVSVLIPASVGGTVAARSGPYGTRIAVGGFAGDLAASPLGDRVFVNRGSIGGLAVITTRDNKQEGGIIAIPDDDPLLLTDYGLPVIVSPDGRLVYVATGDGVAVVNAGSGKLDGSVIPSQSPNDLAFAQRADELYVATSAGVSIVSTTSRKLLGTTLVIPGAYRLLPSADGRRMYVLGSPNRVWTIDTGTRKIIGAPAAHGTQHIAQALGHADEKLYLANFRSESLSVVDVKTMRAAGPAIDVGGVPFDLVSSPDGTRIYASVGTGDVAVIDAETDKVVDRLKSWDGPMGLAISADGRRLYASSSGGVVSVIDTFH